MNTFIFDIDGTLVKNNTNEWLNGAKKLLLDLHNKGKTILLITSRGKHDEGTERSIQKTKETILKDLDNLGIRYQIVFEISSSRILLDNTRCHAVTIDKNIDWNNFELLKKIN